MNQLNVTNQKRKPAPVVNPILEGAKMILGGGFGLFFAVLLLSYFWGIDLLGMQGRAKRDPQQVASVTPAAPAAPVTPAAVTSPPERKLAPPGLTPEEIRAAVERSTPIRKTLASEPAPEPTPEPAAPTPEPVAAPAESVVATQPDPAPSAEPAQESSPVAACPEPMPVSASVPQLPKGQKGAWLIVNRMRPWQIPREVQMPDMLKNGMSFVWQEKPKSAKLELGDLEFQVVKTGVVMLAENWKGQGGGGDWQKTALSREQLIAQGWEPCGTVNWPPVPVEETMELELFQKVCQKGEIYKIRTNKYWPPFVFVPPTK